MSYIEAIFEESTPFAPHFKLSSTMSPSTDTEHEYMSKVPYANAVGSLLYAMVCARPEILHAIGVVSRYMHITGKGYWQPVKWIFRYNLKNVDVGYIFERDNSLNHCIIGYVEFDYAGDFG